MTQVAKAQEPSMEEILASIRRIIADDDGKPSPAVQSAPPAPEPPAAPAPPPPRQAVPRPPAPPPPPAVPSAAPRGDMPSALKQDDVDALLEDGEQGRPTTESQTADVLDLSESMVAPAPPEAAPAAGGFRTIDGEPDVVFHDPEPVPEPPRATAEPPQLVTPPVLERPLLSSATRTAVDSAFNTLAHTVLVQNARTLEDLVREMLRPMLKSWLDDNLPGIVERLVRTEIERVSRGRS